MLPRLFQLRTVEAALHALTTGSRRYLLADEVGLGKTVVAREIVGRLASGPRDGPLRVFYFASGQAVAAQNARRLVPDDAQGKAIPCTLFDASRPSLIAMEDVSGSKEQRIQLFRFTPETAVPIVHGRGRSGVMQERALLRVFVSRVLRWRLPKGAGLAKVFEGSASRTSFSRAVRIARRRYSDGNLLRGFQLTSHFREAAREVFGASSNEHLHSKMEAAAENPRLFIASLRLALTKATLRCLPPDLIVLDEFHRYRERIFSLPEMTGSPGAGLKSGENFRSLLPNACKPALLLLSATPFQLTDNVMSDGKTGNSAADFHRLVGFLHGDGEAGVNAYLKCQALFADFERELAAQQLDSEAMRAARRRLENELLRPRIARIERAAFNPRRDRSEEPRVLSELPTIDDLDLFIRFSSALKDKDRSTAIPYWRAVPYPHQLLGKGYLAWRRASRSKWRGMSGISEDDREGLRYRGVLSNSRLRELAKIFPPEQLAIPWLPPSRPWWPLRGAWRTEAKDPLPLEKGLLFSRFRAVPPGLSGLMSFLVEDWAARQHGWRSHKKLSRQSFLSPKSVVVVALFHGSSWLADRVDPAGGDDRSPKALIRHAVRAIRERLPASVKFDRHSKQHRPVWKVLAMLEMESQECAPISELWRRAIENQGRTGRVGRALKRMEDSGKAIERQISPTELSDLAWFGLSAPGVILLRALKRHWPEATQAENLSTVMDLAWNGLRPYLDRPWFVARLTKGYKGRSYTEALQYASLDGNLEAVLDEHFWLPDPDNAGWVRTRQQKGRLAALRETLGIRSAPVSLFMPTGHNPERRITLSAHAVLPLTDTPAHMATGSGTQKLRADDLRRAFNSPFWPHLLCTTSVGQEGLDFHLWCRRVVHWDLCANPIDLEQREGRVDRYKSLAVRRALAVNLSKSNPASILWTELEAAAERFSDAPGLAPWWICEGARIDRIFLDLPSSEERMRREHVERLRELYRLVLGLPHQADVLRRLATIKADIDLVRSSCLDLGAWRRPGAARSC